MLMLRSDEQAENFVAMPGNDSFRRPSTNDCREVFSRPGRFHPRRWTGGVRQMLNCLTELEFTPRHASPLQKLCEAGSEYGIRRLEKHVSSELLSLLRPRPKQRIKNHLGQIVARATRHCLELEFNAFRCAYQAIHSQKASSTLEIENKFLGQRPHQRLISLFKKFPVLAELWSQLVCQWCDSVAEFLARVEADKRRLSRVFFCGQPLGEIIDLRAGLSDPHNKGRIVMHVQFEAGSIIYKPRCGHGEQEWSNLVGYLNTTSFRPKLTAARVLCRNGYCWMEEIKFAPCKDEAAARRFYKRLGGMIAAAYLVKAVDCHRDNVIASGEHPVLVDAETLWHPAGNNKITSPVDELAATGFLPSSGRRSSYQYRSSALARTSPGKHTPRVAVTPLRAAQYEIEIVNGFRRAWRCLLGAKVRRVALTRRLRRLRGQEWRRIHRSTEAYDKILQASIEPAALQTGADRHAIIASLCRRSEVGEPVIRKEIEALKRLDIPYFLERWIAGLPVPDQNAVPPEISEALRRAVRL